MSSSFEDSEVRKKSYRIGSPSLWIIERLPWLWNERSNFSFINIYSLKYCRRKWKKCYPGFPMFYIAKGLSRYIENTSIYFTKDWDILWYGCKRTHSRVENNIKIFQALLMSHWIKTVNRELRTVNGYKVFLIL